MNNPTEQLVVAGGCFWCTEAVFLQIKGVIQVESGYTGGHTDHPDYASVCTGTTGHAEAIRIVYQPDVVSLNDLLEIHLFTHDPTTLNRQGADTGTQYRSAMFYRNQQEKQIMEQTLARFQDDFQGKIVTGVEPLNTFYPAESYHQNYFERNQNAPYCQIMIPPKLKKLRMHFGNRLKEQGT